MTPEQIQQIIDQILKTGEFLASKSFELALRQIFVYAILDLVVGIPILLLGLVSYWKNRGYWDKKETTGDEDLAITFPVVATTLGFIISLCSIRLFVNPEWYAVRLLLETFIK